MKYFLIRSDNATCSLGKKDCAKVGKEKKHVSFVTQDIPAEEFKERFSKQYPVFVRYKEQVKNQYAVVQAVKGKLLCKWIKQNLLSSHHEEIQATYFYKNSVTLHPLVVYYKKNVQDEDYEEDLGCR